MIVGSFRGPLLFNSDSAIIVLIPKCFQPKMLVRVIGRVTSIRSVREPYSYSSACQIKRNETPPIWKMSGTCYLWPEYRSHKHAASFHWVSVNDMYRWHHTTWKLWRRRMYCAPVYFEQLTIASQAGMKDSSRHACQRLSHSYILNFANGFA